MSGEDVTEKVPYGTYHVGPGVEYVEVRAEVAVRVVAMLLRVKRVVALCGVPVNRLLACAVNAAPKNGAKLLVCRSA